MFIYLYTYVHRLQSGQSTPDLNDLRYRSPHKSASFRSPIVDQNFGRSKDEQLKFLQQEVFNLYNTETEMLRYGHMHTCIYIHIHTYIYIYISSSTSVLRRRHVLFSTMIVAHIQNIAPDFFFGGSFLWVLCGQSIADCLLRGIPILSHCGEEEQSPIHQSKNQ